MTTLVPFLMLQNSKLPLQLYQVYLGGYYNRRRPTCLTPAIADSRRSRPCCFHGQSPFQSTSREAKITGWELHPSTATEGRLLPWRMLLFPWFFCRCRLKISLTACIPDINLNVIFPSPSSK